MTESQKKKEQRMQQATIGLDRLHGQLVDKAGRPFGRPTCTTCTAKERSTARLTMAKERSTARLTDCMMAALCWCRSTGPVDRAQGSVDRPVDRQTRFDFPFGIRIPFLFGIESSWGFLKPRDFVAINKG